MVYDAKRMALILSPPLCFCWVLFVFEDHQQNESIRNGGRVSLSAGAALRAAECFSALS